MLIPSGVKTSLLGYVICGKIKILQGIDTLFIFRLAFSSSGIQSYRALRIDHLRGGRGFWEGYLLSKQWFLFHAAALSDGFFVTVACFFPVTPAEELNAFLEALVDLTKAQWCVYAPSLLGIFLSWAGWYQVTPSRKHWWTLGDGALRKAPMLVKLS